METYFRVRKVVVCLLFIVLVLWAFDTFADIDLGGAKVVREAECKVYGKPSLCVAATLDKKLYIIVFDRKGIVSEYLVNGGTLTLLWARRMT